MPKKNWIKLMSLLFDSFSDVAVENLLHKYVKQY